MNAGDHRDLRVRIASADVDEILSLTLRVVVAARTEGSFFRLSCLGLKSLRWFATVPKW